ncbi:hypothetical protein [Streptomyces luteireticuli]|uniref:Uncharacterized protein n=1 Tax=Streptomyces luteireticuli TaxID=173858 RepID=A0ABP3IRD0_9ACTN
MRELLEKIETRQQLVRETAGRLRDRIARLTGQLAAAEQTLSRPETTRETILELDVENGPRHLSRCPLDTARSWHSSSRPKKDSVPGRSPGRSASAPSHDTPRTPGPS